MRDSIPHPPSFFLVRHPSGVPFVGVLAALVAAAGSLSVAAPLQDPRARAQQGQAALSAGRFEEAATIYAEIVQAMPNEPGLRLNLGMALSMSGRPREALPHLEAALVGRPDLIPAALFLGAVHMELGQPAQAVKPLETFLAAQPANGEARKMLAEAQLVLERYGSAARQYRALSEQVPQDPRAWYGLGRSYEGLSRQAFERLQTSGPDSAFILLAVAEGMVSQERDKSAFTLYREALEKRPDLAEAHAALAAIYERSDHPDWAAQQRKKAAAVPRVDCGLARLECDFRAGRYGAVLEAAGPLQTPESHYWLLRAAGELARQAFGRLGQLPRSPEAVLAEVGVLEAQRRYAQSKEVLEKAVAAWPEDRRLHRELARLLFMGREYEAARAALEDLLKLEPESAELNLLQGEAWLEQRQPRKAVPFLEAAHRQNPEGLQIRAILGRAYVDSGEAARAVPHLEAALKIDVDGSLYFQLSRAYQAVGQLEKAKEARATFQEIRRKNKAQEESAQDEFSITPPEGE